MLQCTLLPGVVVCIEPTHVAHVSCSLNEGCLSSCRVAVVGSAGCFSLVDSLSLADWLGMRGHRTSLVSTIRADL